MPTPKACPVCCTDRLEAIVRKPLSAPDELDTAAVSGTYAYRCANGHVFMVAAEGPKAAKKAAGD
jgi:hypothetical protein